MVRDNCIRRCRCGGCRLSNWGSMGEMLGSSRRCEESGEPVKFTQLKLCCTTFLVSAPVAGSYGTPVSRRQVARLPRGNNPVDHCLVRGIQAHVGSPSRDVTSMDFLIERFDLKSE